ncbi:hypothetical protein GCM10022224_079970 [Nonomuraea antimicrobica]|uniref:Uncharacterized protein n=1 Tax=Nonomuraea antimicrobica TaxID=561173 RepID=A0ABP7DBG5_9ACTN
MVSFDLVSFDEAGGRTASSGRRASSEESVTHNVYQTPTPPHAHERPDVAYGTDRRDAAPTAAHRRR